MGRRALRIAVDTNLLVRTAVRDDEDQARLAEKAISQATVVAVSPTCMCEFAWVLRRTYRFQAKDLEAAITTLLSISNVRTNRPAIEAGLAVLRAGGDFADGVIAYEGNWLGGEAFVSFDKRAVTLLSAQGYPAYLLR